MIRTLATAATIPIVALAVGLCGCKQNSASAGATLVSAGSSYCTPFKTTQAMSTSAVTDPAAGFEECVHRWSYTLAPARDSADVVAQAAVDACSSALSHWNEQTLSQNPQSPPEPATSLTTGQPTDLMGERAQYAQSRALFYVVQARAGRCAPPPAETMAAAG